MRIFISILGFCLYCSLPLVLVSVYSLKFAGITEGLKTGDEFTGIFLRNATR